MTEKQKTIDGNKSFVNKNDYVRIFVFCTNCRSRHHQYFLKELTVTTCNCTKCCVASLVSSDVTYKQYHHQQLKEREKRGETVHSWER